MNWVRRGFVGFLASLLLFSLVGGVLSIGISQNLGKPDKLKELLSENGVYDKIVNSALNESEQENQQAGNDTSVSLNDQVIKTEAQKVFTPQLLEQHVNTFIDSNFAWLKGDTTKPDFRIDLSGAKEDLATRIGTFVANRLNGLPVCTAEQQAQLQIPVDPMTVDCRPNGIDPKTEGDRVTQEVRNSEFLSEPVLTADTLGKDSNKEKPYYINFSKAPEAYQLALKLPLILGTVAVLAAIGIIFASPSRRQGVRRIASTLFVAGITLLAMLFVSNFASDKLTSREPKDSTASQLQQPVNDVIRDAQTAINQNNLAFGTAFLILAVIIFTYLILTRHKKVKPHNPDKAVREMNEKHLSDERPAGKTGIDPNGIPLAQRNKPTSIDVRGPVRPSGTQGSSSGISTAPPVPKKPRPPKPPRLIQ